MADPITESLSKYWEEDDETAWRGFATGFLTKAPAQRVQDLRVADSWIDQYQQTHTQPTRELGSLIQRRRELLDLHAAMLKANR